MQFNKRGNTYLLDEEFISMLKEWNGYIIVVGGPSGVGKTTLSEAMGYYFVPSFTTRERRKQHETYDFISNEQYEEMKKSKSFGTSVSFHLGDNYGVSKERFIEASREHKVLVFTLSPIGYRMLKRRYSRTIGIFVYADWEVVEKRLLGRDGFLDEVRVKSYKNNLRSKDFYHIKVNNNSNRIFMKVLKIHLLIKVIQLLDHTKAGYGMRKKLFPARNEITFNNQQKEKRKKKEMRLKQQQEISSQTSNNEVELNTIQKEKAISH